MALVGAEAGRDGVAAAAAGTHEHVVRQGECLSSLARKYGLPGWEAIYRHASNEAFRRLRPNPHVIHPGDRVNIPDLRQKQEPGATELRHRFRLKGTPVPLRVYLRDTDGLPYARCRYVLRAEQRTFEGRTNDEGLVEVLVPAQDEKAQLLFWPLDDPDSEPFVMGVRIGHLDPSDEDTGVCGRLANLGHLAEDPDEDNEAAVADALRAFQARHGLPSTGRADRATREALLDDHHRM